VPELARLIRGLGKSRLPAVLSALLLVTCTLCSCGVTAGGKLTIDNPYNFSMPARILAEPHCHTTKSDGREETSVVINRYAKAGYGALAITDHNIVNWPWPSRPPGLIPIQGDEVSKYPTLQNMHIMSLFCGYAPKDATLDPQATINAIKGDDGLAVIAHPYFSMKAPADLAKLNGYNGVEIYNRSSELISNRGYSVDIWDYLLSNTGNRKIWGYAVDDYHFDPADFNRGKIMVIAPVKSADDIKTALRSGSFFAIVGTGDLRFRNISVSGQTIEVVTSGPSDITFFGYRGRPLSGRTATTRAVYKLTGNERYVRVQAVSSDGGTTVYSNPISVDRAK
jgi:hypothetical protein